MKNSKTRFETDGRNPSETERKSSDFAPYGMALDCFHNCASMLCRVKSTSKFSDHGRKRPGTATEHGTDNVGKSVIHLSIRR